MEIEVISKDKLSDYKHLMLSYIYEELDAYPDDLDCDWPRQCPMKTASSSLFLS